MTHDTSGQTYLRPFATYDPNTQSLRMFEDTLLSDSIPFSGILPQSGMMRNGVLFELPKSAQPTKEQDYTLLPTPIARDYKGINGNGDNMIAALRMLPTPKASDTFTGNLKSSQIKPGSMHSVTLPQAVHMDWRQFAPAIERWEQVIGRPAPVPAIDGKLNPEFTEWLMGLPKGWVSDVDISWSQKIKACGNGVVPQAAELALKRIMNKENR